MKFMCSLILVEDIKKARFFYEEILGQTVKEDYGENVVFNGDFAIHLKDHYEKLIGEKVISLRSNNFELYFEDDNLDDIVKILKKHDIEFIHEIREQPWQQQVIRFYDYDYNIIEVGEKLEHTAFRLYKKGVKIDEICNITYLSNEDIQKAIKDYS